VYGFTIKPEASRPPTEGEAPMSTTFAHLSTEQVTALQDDGYAAAMADQPAAPALSAAFQQVIAGLPVGTPTFTEAAEAFQRGYRSGGYFRSEATALNGQGLGTLLLALREAGHDPIVNQTGGFCMVLTVPLLDGTLWAISGEGEESYNVIRLTEADWNEGCEEPISETLDVPTAAVLDVIAFRTA